MNIREALKTVISNKNWQYSAICLILATLTPVLVFINSILSIVVCIIFAIGWLYWAKKFIDQVEGMFNKSKPN